MVCLPERLFLKLLRCWTHPLLLELGISSLLLLLPWRADPLCCFDWHSCLLLLQRRPAAPLLPLLLLLPSCRHMHCCHQQQQ